MAVYNAMLQRQREYFRTGESKSVEFRVRQAFGFLIYDCHVTCPPSKRP